MAMQVFVDGFDRTANLRSTQSVTFRYTLGSRASMTCEFLDVSGGGYRPAVGETVELVADLSTTQFFGTIMSVEETLLDGNEETGVITSIAAVDQWLAATQRVVSARTYTAKTLKFIVTDLMPLVEVFELTLDPDMADGDLMTVTFETQSLGDVYRNLSVLTDWINRVTPEGVIQWFPVGGFMPTVLYSLADADVRSGVTVTQTRDAYINRQFIIYGSLSVVTKTWSAVGDGTVDRWTLPYQAMTTADGHVLPYNLIADDSFGPGAQVPLGVATTFPEPLYWEYDPTTNQVIRKAGNLPTGAIASLPINVQFPLTTYQEDADDIAANGPREAIERKPEIFDTVQADAYALAVVRRSVDAPRELHFETPIGMALPGDELLVELTGMDVDGYWFVTNVGGRDLDDQTTLYAYSCLEGTLFKKSWVDFWHDRLGGGSSASSSGSASGVLIPPGTGGGGGSGTAPSRVWTPLASSLTEYVQSPTPTWVSVSGMPALLDTTVRGTTAATVYARLRATAGSVKARLYDVTNEVSVGESAVVSTTTWTDLTFSATLTAGANMYALEVLPSLQNTDVAGGGAVL